jgi:hypothetical protein
VCAGKGIAPRNPADEGLEHELGEGCGKRHGYCHQRGLAIPPPQNTCQHQGRGHRDYRHRLTWPDQRGQQHVMPSNAGHYFAVDRYVDPTGFHPVLEPHSLYCRHKHAGNHKRHSQGAADGRQQRSFG